MSCEYIEHIGRQRRLFEIEQRNVRMGEREVRHDPVSETWNIMMWEKEKRAW